MTDIIVVQGKHREKPYAIWRNSDTDIWACEDFATLTHYDGTSWTKHDIGKKVVIRCIWGSSSSDIWARVLYVSVPEPLQFSKADKGFKIMINEGKEALLHYDGTTWTKHDPFDIYCTS